MTKQKLGAIILILVLGTGDVYLSLKQNEMQKQLQTTEAGLVAADAKTPIIEFNQLFVDKVLRAEGEVSFDTRLELENKVRNLNDAEMLEQWNKFVNANTEAEAQTEVKELLGLLAQRMNS